MQEIVKRGGWCVRIGDPTMKKMPAMDGVIDYAHSEHRSDWMDVFLCASCVFFLGNSSGPYLISSIFGVPVALANLAPLGVVLPFGKRDIGIPKLLRAVGGGLLSFREALESPVSNARFAAQYRELGIEVVDNTPEDIASLALEQLGRVFGSIEYTAKDEELQNCFKSLMKESHYTFGSTSRIGRDFLRSYAHLLPDPSVSRSPASEAKTWTK
jgi:putative glycosyltransferase (TIGR04372 family)